jgi:hypothetical protein
VQFAESRVEIRVYPQKKLSFDTLYAIDKSWSQRMIHLGRPATQFSGRDPGAIR